MTAPRIDLTGRVFERWSVLEYLGASQWLCRCACGVERAVHGPSLRKGISRSCGCLALELSTKHGHTVDGRSATYMSYYNMLERCYNPNAKHYEYYGGAGIRVCRRWRGKDGFIRFLADMGIRPEGHTLDRRSSAGHYGPTNCRWATRKTQVDNRRNVVKHAVHGEAHTLKEWASLRSIPYMTLRSRIAAGWSIQQALTMIKHTRR